MTPSAIKKYFLTHQRLTLDDLALHFDTDPDAMRGMLQQWIRKGRVVKTELNTCGNPTCSGCCHAPTLELYEWKGENLGNG